MADYAREIKRLLLDHGCSLVRQGKGDHEIWYGPITDRRLVVDGKIKARHTANGIMKQAGIARHF